jgi:hypothetical protein
LFLLHSYMKISGCLPAPRFFWPRFGRVDERPTVATVPVAGSSGGCFADI